MKLATLALILALPLTGRAGIAPFQHLQTAAAIKATQAATTAKAQPIQSGYQFFPALGQTIRHIPAILGRYIFASVQDIRIVSFTIATPIPVTACLLEIDNRPLPVKK